TRLQTLPIRWQGDWMPGTVDGRIAEIDPGYVGKGRQRCYLSFNLLVRFNAPRGSDEAFLAEGVAGMAQACALSQGRWPREALNSGWRFRRTPVVGQCAWRGRVGEVGACNPTVEQRVSRCLSGSKAISQRHGLKTKTRPILSSNSCGDQPR